ncbi:GNAT family N-acetyltransferase [Paenibacillus tarimensis]|uniref:GNAT family N-acetyltransferase n=1 Tax=Paenibacillus tarimensis TaxID=416012 RepID=UPI001F1AAA03|nr:GNAT family N-acetyltransferase [Paenibacillus tarimensis]MCF2946408.1 GNAT family N-acetyltransferase [Paenibacillus tarimensis]
MQVRSFQLSDYRPLTQLLETTLTEVCYEETMEAFARQLSWDSDLVLVATTFNQEVVGMIIGTIDQNRGYYYRIAVHPEYQRQGIGKLLIGALRQRFEQRNVSQILITADEYNEPILSLYESMGYAAKDFFKSFQKLSIVAG